MSNWTRVRRFLKHDGALRDIVVQGTSEADWNAAFEALRRRQASLSAKFDGSSTSVPEVFDESVWKRATEGVLSITLDWRTIELFAFPSPRELEWSFWPGQIENERQFLDLIAFMRLIADATRKPAILTEENGRDDESAILQVDPCYPS